MIETRTDSAVSPVTVTRENRLGRVLHEEFPVAALATWWLNRLPRLLPEGACGRLRGRLYRVLGTSVGKGTIISGAITFGAGSLARNLRIGSRCFVNSHVFLDTAGATITLGDGVSIGHHVVFVTTNHEIGPENFRAGSRQCAPIVVGDGVWIAANVTILPGVTIGAGSIVAAGAVVARDVPPNTLVGGVPARIIRSL